MHTFILKILSKPHAHLQTLEKTCTKFQKDRYKIVRGVAIIRYAVSIYLRSENDKVHKVETVTKIQGLHQKHMHIFRLSRKPVQSFKKIGIKLYEELLTRYHSLYSEGEKNTRFTMWK